LPKTHEDLICLVINTKKQPSVAVTFWAVANNKIKLVFVRRTAFGLFRFVAVTLLFFGITFFLLAAAVTGRTAFFRFLLFGATSSTVSMRTSDGSNQKERDQ
jgi:hypothetical protein